MKNIIVISLFCTAMSAYAQTSTSQLPATNEASTSKAPIELPKSRPSTTRPASMRLMYLASSSSQSMDYKSLKTTGSDDTGSMSESSTIPNLSYLFAVGSLPFAERHKVSMIALQSVNRDEERKVKMPYGTDFIIPGQILALKYQYNFTREFFVDAKDCYVDPFGVSDPSVGVGFQNTQPTEWSQKISLNTTAPTTQRSYNERLATKSTLRTQASYTWERVKFTSALSLTKSFYQGGNKGPLSSRRSSSSSSSSSSASSSGGAPTISARPSEIDLLISEAEIQRNTLNLGVNYNLTDRWQLSSAVGVTDIYTQKEHDIWITTIKPIGVSYMIANYEFGSELNLNTDISRASAIDLPNQWSLGFRVGYMWEAASNQ